MESIAEKLEMYGQEHILDLPTLSMDSPILKQVDNLDLPRVLNAYNKAKLQMNELNTKKNITQIQVIHKLENSESKSFYKKIGYEAINQNKVAVIILSGGQGTRLGYDGPKGMYDIGLPSKKSIFELHVDKVRKIRELVAQEYKLDKNPSLPIYIMTSDLNDTLIRKYFKDNEYFNYPSEDIYFFEQGLEPCLSLDGKLIIESEESIALAPDGNGGIYKALHYTGALENMISRGIKHLHVYGIDNVLNKSADPIFVGLCIEKEVQCGNKIVWRADKSEKVGVSVEVDGRLNVIEYSEIPPHLAEVSDDSGKLIYGAANICNHYLSVEFIKECLYNIDNIYHLADKKIPYYDLATKQKVNPTKTNGHKLEMFIFDVFPLATKWLVFEVDREDEFAPVKNAPGSASDSPDTARALISNQAKKWIRAAGGTLILEELQSTIFESSSSNSSTCEISIDLSYEGEGLEMYSGQQISCPFYLK